MKKLIATLLAVIMICSSFAVMTSALTLEEYKAAQDPEQVIFLFDTAGISQMGTVYQGTMEKINEGNYSGMYAISGEGFRPGRNVQLPGTISTVSDYTANWNLTSDIRENGNSDKKLLPTGTTYGSGSSFDIPDYDQLKGQIIIFRAQGTPIETQSVLGKIIVVFAKIIKALFSEDTARGFLQLFVDMDLGLDIDIDAVFPPKAAGTDNP